MGALFTIENLTALITLTMMEIVLGIDNIIFIAILVSRLEKKLQKKARTIGLVLALFFRIGLLLSLKWIMGLTQALFTLRSHDVTGRDLILFFGGLFLVGKSTLEIHQKMEEAAHQSANPNHQIKKSTNFAGAVIQIMLIDIIFSFDSVITAIGMAQAITIMILAVFLSMLIMLKLSGVIADFVERQPTIKILALAFLILIGVMLIMESTGSQVSKGYIYFAMAFSLVVEIINMNYRKKAGIKS